MYFVTGGTGLVGSFAIKKLIAEGKPVRALKRAGSCTDLTMDVNPFIEWVEGELNDIPLLENYLEGVHCIIHSAGLVSYSPKQKEKIFEVNYEGTRNIVNAAISVAVDKFIHVSSVASLNKKKDDVLISEENSYQFDQLNTSYGQSKLLAELEVYRGFEEGLQGFMINPSVIFGPGHWEKGSTKIFEYIFNENPYYSTGLCNYVDVRDIAEILYKLERLPIEQVNREKFIVSAGTISYKELFSRIATCFNKKAPGISASPFMTEIAWRLEWIKSVLTGKEPLITKESSQLGRSYFTYTNKKIKNVLDFSFRKLDDTISWTCRELLKKNQRK